jgi:3'-phosphoadenosine 5'-phosphosulfate (PAPS) 3'-phosphatase
MSSPLDFAIFGAYRREAEVIFAALSEGTHVSLQARHPLDSLAKFHKPDSSIVTAADFLVQAHILNALITSFPSDVILAEESLKGDLDPDFLTEVANRLPPELNLSDLSHTLPTVPATVERWWAAPPVIASRAATTRLRLH